MIELAGKPTVGVYVLTRELPAALAFWGPAMAHGAAGAAGGTGSGAAGSVGPGGLVGGVVGGVDYLLGPETDGIGAIGAGAHGSGVGGMSAGGTGGGGAGGGVVGDAAGGAAGAAGGSVTARGGREAPARFAALHQQDQTSHVLYRLPVVRGQRERERVRAAVEAAAAVKHPHVLRIQELVWDPVGHPWIVTPFTGDVDGVRPLPRLVREKLGQLSPNETEHALEQLLDALRHAHTGGAGGDGAGGTSIVHHGPVSWEHVLVDRHGSLIIELYGLARLLDERAGEGSAGMDMVREEVRSVVEIGYRVMTGLRPEEPLIPASRLVKGLDAAWDAYFSAGLDVLRGFGSAAEAIAALPGRQMDDAAGRRVGGAPGAGGPPPGKAGGNAAGWSVWNWISPRG